MSFAGTMLNAIFSLVFVIGLILLTAWVFRWWQKNQGNFKSFAPAARTPARVAVISTTAIDMKRKLVLVRRDDVLHLLLCGDGQDIVVETQIPLETTDAAHTTKSSATD